MSRLINYNNKNLKEIYIQYSHQNIDKTTKNTTPTTNIEKKPNQNHFFNLI